MSLASGRTQDDNRLKGLVGPDFNLVNELPYRVCLIEIENPRDVKWNSSENDWESITFHLSLILRSIFEKYSLRPLITLKNNRLTVIALDIQSKLPGKLRLQQALDSLQHIRADEKLKDLQARHWSQQVPQGPEACSCRLPGSCTSAVPLFLLPEAGPHV